MNPRDKIEKALRQWLRDHYAVISYDEALNLGASRAIVVSKVNRGEWERLHRGVYRDTATPPSPYQALRAGYLATGGHGVVSHASAGWVWGLLSQPPTKPELTVPIDARRGPGRAGLTIHRSRTWTCRRWYTATPSS